MTRIVFNDGGRSQKVRRLLDLIEAVEMSIDGRPVTVETIARIRKIGTERHAERIIKEIKAPNPLSFPPERLTPAEPTASGVPPRATRDVISSGKVPLIYMPPSAYERPTITNALRRMYEDPRRMASPDAWEDLLATAGTVANVYVFDRHGERYRVEHVRFYPGGESGELEIVHIGRRGRLRVDLHDAFGYMLPVVAYKPTRLNPPSGEDSSVTLYHGTLRRKLPKILRRGLQPSEGWGGANTFGVFLSGTPEGALYWAKLAHQRDKDEKLEVGRFDRAYGDRAAELLAIVEVTIPPAEIGQLKADMEQAEDVGFEGDRDDWEASLEEIGDVMFDGQVPASWVREVPMPARNIG